MWGIAWTGEMKQFVGRKELKGYKIVWIAPLGILIRPECLSKPRLLAVCQGPNAVKVLDP